MMEGAGFAEIGFDPAVWQHPFPGINNVLNQYVMNFSPKAVHFQTGQGENAPKRRNAASVQGHG
jgi:hypothetical protein